MQFLEILFLASCFVVFYNYAGYALIAGIANLFRPKNRVSREAAQFTPTISFIVAAYNEEDFIEKKIKNSIGLDYPATRIEYIFITDGSTDGTNDIIKRFPMIRLMHQSARAGKSAAINRAVKEAKNDILIFSDANTTLSSETLFTIARQYHDEKVGGVAGEKKVVNPEDGPNEVGAGEGLYWKYESALKRIDSKFYSVVGAAGELFSLRRSLYEDIPHNVILDDFVISLRVAQKGYRVIYEPRACAVELPSFSMKDEQKRKVRIAAGGFQAIGMLTPLLKFWKYPKLSFLYISHRVLRWTLTPVCLIIALLSNLVLFLNTNSVWYEISFYLQAGFYLAALLVMLIPPMGKIKLFKLAYYFTFMNVSVILGFFRYLKGNQSAAWEKARRAPVT